MNQPVRPEPDAGRTIQVIDRATALLRAIVARPGELNVQDLSSACDLNRTTAWRILSSLQHNGLVYRDPRTQRYRPGVDLARLGEAADIGPLIRISRAHLQRLADEVHEQVFLGVPQHLGFRYIEHVQPTDRSDVPRWLGQSGPLHASASGKLFLSRLSPTEREAVLSHGLPGFTKTTITDRAELDRQLEAIRVDGFALAIGEYDEFTSAVCAPALDPHDGRLVAIVDAWGPALRLDRQRIREIAPLVCRTAVEIGTLTGQHDREVSGQPGAQPPPRLAGHIESIQS